MFRDEYTNFSFNELDSENFKVWITNKNDLKRNMSPNFSDKFNTPTGSQIRYHEGTTIDKQDFKLSCAAVDVTLNEWRAITEWLSPLKQGKLRFEWNDKYYYMVKISKAPSGTMFMKGRVDDIMGQLYIITFDLEFTTVYDWAALGNYAEQNSIKEIDMSVYNNEYCIPSIIMRDKYSYRASLTSQTMYPSGDVVIVSSGDMYDFTTLVAGSNNIKEVSGGKTPLPEKITFEFGYAPLVKVWDAKQGVFQANDIAVCSDDIEAIKDIKLVVENENFKLQYKTSYNEDKCIVLTLETQGVVDEYEGRFILAGVLNKDEGDPRYKYPVPEVSFTIEPNPTVVFRGGVYTITSVVKNSYNTVQWSVGNTTQVSLIPNENGCKVIIPLDSTDESISLMLLLKDPAGNIVQQVINASITDPKIQCSIDKRTIGINDVVELTANLDGLQIVNFQWVIKAEDTESVAIENINLPVTNLRGLKPDKEVKISAKGENILSDEIGSNELTLEIIDSTVEISPSEVTAKMGDIITYPITIIGEQTLGQITYEIKPEITGMSSNIITEDGIQKIKVWLPENLVNNAGESIDEAATTLTVYRTFDDGRVVSSSSTITIIRGIAIKNIPTKQLIFKDRDGNYITTYVDVANVLDFNNFDSGIYNDVWSSSDEDVLTVQRISEANLKLIYFKPGKVTLTCKLIDNDETIVDSASIVIDVMDSKAIDWSSGEIIKYTVEDPQERRENNTDIYDFELANIIDSILSGNDRIVRIVQNEYGLYNIAYYDEIYAKEELVIQVSLHDFQEYNGNYELTDIFKNGESFDVVIRNKVSIDAEGLKIDNYNYFIPNDDWNADENVEVGLDFLSSYYKKASKMPNEYVYYFAGWEDSKVEYLPLELIENYSERVNNGATFFYPKNVNSKNRYGYFKGDGFDLTYFIVPNSYSNNLKSGTEYYDHVTLIKDIIGTDLSGTNTEISFFSNPYLEDKTKSKYVWYDINGYFRDKNSYFEGEISFFGRDYKLFNKGGEIIEVSNSSATVEIVDNKLKITLPQNDEIDRGKVTFSDYSVQFNIKPRHAIDSIYTSLVDETDLIPTTFSLRRSSMSLRSGSTANANSYIDNLPDGSVPQLGIVDFNNNIVGYIYNNNGLTYHRHYFDIDATDTELKPWDELIGSPSYYEFQSHPSYSLINHNFKPEGEGNENYNDSLRLLIKANTNTAICNTGVFNMYPLFFIKGGCVISDQLQSYYSFLTNTNMKNLFVTINSRTSTMLHNGYAIDASYNSLGMPLFKNIKNENQLVIPSGRPELLKVIFESDEEIKYQNSSTDRRIATFKINSKPVYGLRNKFALHIFNESFHNQVSNIYNKDNYNSLSYYNTFSKVKHILLDTPEIAYYQQPEGWKMTVSYKAIKEYPNFVRHPGSKSDDEYSNVVSIGNMIGEEKSDKILYISICDCKELEVRSEGEDYSIGCQSRGVI